MNILVALSGGVDSSMTALLLKEEGHHVETITFKFSSANEHHIIDAQNFSKNHDFTHHVIEAVDEFNELVIDPFCESYLQGKTPNPCIECNPKMKFAKLISYAIDHNFDRVATGHYCSLHESDIPDTQKRYFIRRSKDDNKDQSYFLSRLNQNQLQHLLFPLSSFSKHEVQAMAQEKKLSVAKKPESQEICFIPNDDYISFIQSHVNITSHKGPIVDTEGNIIGEHNGIFKFTVGQRRGIGISAPYPLYVLHINAQENTIVVGQKQFLEKKTLLATKINYMKETDLHNKNVFVKTRSTQKPFPAHLSSENESIRVSFTEPQIGISPGQTAAFYNRNGDILGAGEIEE